jgi:hypothetical protein
VLGCLCIRGFGAAEDDADDERSAEFRDRLGPALNLMSSQSIAKTAMSCNPPATGFSHFSVLRSLTRTIRNERFTPHS